jgi:hypothetical protein
VKGFDLSQSRDDPFPFPFRNEKKYADQTIGFLYSAGYMIMYMTVMIVLVLLRNLYDN